MKEQPILSSSGYQIIRFHKEPGLWSVGNLLLVTLFWTDQVRHMSDQ